VDLEAYDSSRPSVLGYRMLFDAQRGRYALVRDAAPGEPLCAGTLEECEGELIARLAAEHGTGEANLALPTLGGLQFWGDRFWFAGWRIQENVLTGHSRLLDDRGTRRAWGSYEACRTVFETERVRRHLEQPSVHLVILLHGLFRTRGSLDKLGQRLEEEGYAVARLAYPSTRRSIGEHADAVTRVLDSLEGIERVSFVTHSLGGLIARVALARDAAWRDHVEPGRLVMLAPPSRGSSLASELRDFLPFQWLAGPAGQQVVVEEASSLPEPDVPFGIIAGGKGDGRGWNQLIEGDDDGVVAVSETRLEGAADFLVVRAMHTFLMDDPEVIDRVVRFLATGRFE
jgi:hypothetical protein